MLRNETAAGWVRNGHLMLATYTLVVGTGKAQMVSPPVSARQFKRILARQATAPVAVMVVPARRRCYWMFQDEVWWEDESLSEKEVQALILAKRLRRQRTIQEAVALVNRDGQPAAQARIPIPDQVRAVVWARDGGKCVKCGATQELQFDHIIPVAKGGSSTADNVQVLCRRCNMKKREHIA